MENKDIKLLAAPEKYRYVPPWYFLDVMAVTILNRSCEISKNLALNNNPMETVIEMYQEREKLRIALDKVFDKLEAMGRPTDQEYYHKHLTPSAQMVDSLQPLEINAVNIEEFLKVLNKLKPPDDEEPPTVTGSQFI